MRRHLRILADKPQAKPVDTGASKHLARIYEKRSFLVRVELLEARVRELELTMNSRRAS